jgi:hypothetical protein
MGAPRLCRRILTAAGRPHIRAIWGRFQLTVASATLIQKGNRLGLGRSGLGANGAARGWPTLSLPLPCGYPILVVLQLDDRVGATRFTPGQPQGEPHPFSSHSSPPRLDLHHTLFSGWLPPGCCPPTLSPTEGEKGGAPRFYSLSMFVNERLGHPPSSVSPT